MTLEEFKFIYFWEYAHRMMGRCIGFAYALPAAYFISSGAITRTMFPRIGNKFTRTYQSNINSPLKYRCIVSNGWGPGPYRMVDGEVRVRKGLSTLEISSQIVSDAYYPIEQRRFGGK
jgi:hypothetical protein